MRLKADLSSLRVFAWMVNALLPEQFFCNFGLFETGLRKRAGSPQSSSMEIFFVRISVLSVARLTRRHTSSSVQGGGSENFILWKSLASVFMPRTGSCFSRARYHGIPSSGSSSSA